MFILAAVLAALTMASAQPPADLVIENARIWSDGQTGFASFAAVHDGRFVHVGPPDEAFIGPDTQRVDAQERTVIPGLIDSHVHMLGGGRGLAEIQLRSAVSKTDFINRVEQWTKQLPDGAWLLGGRWSVESWDSPQDPTRAWLDPITGDHPAFLQRMDGHSALVNSKALELAGIDEHGPEDPVGGVIDRHPTTGEPTGILRESAMHLVARHIPDPSAQESLHALRKAMDHALANGITSVADIPDLGDLPVYAALVEADDQPMRLFLYLSTGDWRPAISAADAFTAKSGWTQVNGFKAYLDGSLGSRTAMMRDPFQGNPPDRKQWAGLFAQGVEDGQFDRNITAAADAGYQSIVHAIGDEANHYLLNTLEESYPSLPTARCRSEHTQHLLPEDIARFGSLGVIASMQPYHKADDGRYAENIIGPDRSRSSYAYKSLLDAGAVLIFGSDWPVVTINPFEGINAAVTGEILTGDHWQTQENISVADALRCYTSHAAYGLFQENELGKIAPGYRADFVILNASPFDPTIDLKTIHAIATYVEGTRRYEASSNN